MTDSRIYKARKIHTDPTRWDLRGDVGTDNFQFDIPDGKVFSRYKVEVSRRSPFAGYDVVTKPQRRATGTQKLDVRWSYEPNGMIKYVLKVYAKEGQQPDELETRRVKIFSHGWQDKVRSYIDQGITVQLELVPQIAEDLEEFLQAGQARVAETIRGIGGGVLDAVLTPQSLALTGGEVLLGVAAIGAMAAVGSLAIIAPLIAYALYQGYEVKYVDRTRAGGTGLSLEGELVFTKRAS